MLASRFHIATSKNSPAGAEAASHRLLLQGGYIIQHASGIYSFSPLGQKVLRNIANLITEEMEQAGALHVQMPVMQPAALWRESDRWDAYTKGQQMFTVEDRKGAAYGLAPTAEEVATAIARTSIKSETQLPYTIFQIGQKFRDELRPRNGLMRTKEFTMMDGYSFDATKEGLAQSYELIRSAYYRIFNRVNLKFGPVDADMGGMGGVRSEEFMAFANIGEDTILYTPSGYAANIEKAVSTLTPLTDVNSADLTLHAFKLSKTDGSTSLAAVFTRRGSDVNPVKLKNLLSFSEGTPIASHLVAESSELAHVVVDNSVATVPHIRFEQLCGRTLPADSVRTADVRLARAGEVGPDGQLLQEDRGIEIGHIFQLGDRYSRAMKAGYTDRAGQFQPFQMGCYGIGVSRVMAAIVEQNHDANGIIWPEAVTPFQVQIIPSNLSDTLQTDTAKDIYQRLKSEGVNVLLDDRDIRMGEKFKDADLIGAPFRIVAGRDVKNGQVEVKNRRSGLTGLMPASTLSYSMLKI